MTKSLFVAALLALGLGAHQDAAAQSFLDSLKGAIGSDKTPAAETTHLDRAMTATRRDYCGGDGQVSLLNASVEQGLGIVGEKEISAYLQGIATKLLQNSPYPDCMVTVYVTPHDAAQAVALADGGVMIAIGFLRNLKNEDEVAALLGHELSHILLDHHSSDALVDSQDGFLKGLEAANASGGMLLGAVDPRLNRTVNAGLSVGDAVYNISESMIAPAWTMEQEDEADLLGTDLLVAAGYNPRAMVAVMDVIEAHEANAAAVEKERDKLYNARMSTAAMETASGAVSGDALSIISGVADLTSTVVSGGDKKTHRPAAERKSSINSYIREVHNGDRRRPFTVEPWEARLNKGESGKMFAQYTLASKARRAVFTGGDLTEAKQDAKAAIAGAFANDPYPRLALSEVSLRENKPQDAFTNLEVPMNKGEAPWQVYRSYADMQMTGGDVAGATRTVEDADRRFGRPLGVAPYAIKVFRTAGNQAKVDEYMQRCQKGGSRELLKVCQTAAGLDPEAGSAQQPGTGLGGLFSGFGSK